LPPGSNESEASDPQFRKLHRLMNRTFRGITMESIFEGSNAKDSIRVNSKSAAKVIQKKEIAGLETPAKVWLWRGITISVPQEAVRTNACSLILIKKVR
jgi:hypothetical protein